MKLPSKVANVVTSVKCEKAGNSFNIRIRKGNGPPSTIAVAFDEFHARSITMAVRDLYGLKPTEFEKEDFFWEKRLRSVKAFKKLKQEGHKHDLSDWNNFATKTYASLKRK